MLLALLAPCSRAEAVVVTLCSSDVEGGPNAPNLQAAIKSGGSITFQCASPAPTIQLTRQHPITRATSIDGGGVVTLDGSNRRMFDVKGGAWFRLSNISLRRGAGVVAGSGTVELIRASVKDSVQAIWLHSGSVQIVDSLLESNTQTSVFAYDSVRISGSRFLGNSGTPIYAWRGTISIVDSLFVGNGRSEFISGECELTIRNSQFNSQTTSLDGGALLLDCPATIETSQFRNNKAANGGAIFIGPEASKVTMRRVSFADNFAEGEGGAIAIKSSSTARPSVTLRHSRFEQNTARWGGAISFNVTPLGHSLLQGAALTFRGNRAKLTGGAIHLVEASVRIGQSLFLENEAENGGGAIYLRQILPLNRALFANSLFVRNESKSGGSAYHGSSGSFINTTISENSGTAIWPDGDNLPFNTGRPAPSFPISFKNTIVMAKTGPPCGAEAPVVPYLDEGHNLQYPGTSCGSSIISAYPSLGPFFAPLPWSPALNNGEQSACMADPVSGRDMYGIKRPLFERCAIGAAEGDIPRLISNYLRRHRELGNSPRD
jgi:predicted outer membrane repeat protein